MRPFAIGGTAYLYAYTILYMLTHGRFSSPDELSDVYLVFMSLYAGTPEVKRWMTRLDPYDPNSWTERLRKGGPIITLWVVLYAAAVTWRIIDPAWPMPPELKTITVQTMLVFFGSYALRQARKRAARNYDPSAQSLIGEDLRVREQVLEILRARGASAPRELHAAVGVSRRTLNRILAQMIQEGLITRGDAAVTDAYAPYRLIQK